MNIYQNTGALNIYSATARARTLHGCLNLCPLVVCVACQGYCTLYIFLPSLPICLDVGGKTKGLPPTTPPLRGRSFLHTPIILLYTNHTTTTTIRLAHGQVQCWLNPFEIGICMQIGISIFIYTNMHILCHWKAMLVGLVAASGKIMGSCEFVMSEKRKFQIQFPSHRKCNVPRMPVMTNCCKNLSHKPE